MAIDDDLTYQRTAPSDSAIAKVGLIAEGMSAGYNGTAIVKTFDFAAHAGELTALIGPNGSGKSTALKAMARVLPVLAGKVSVGDLDVHRAHSRTVAQSLALLPQGPVAPEGLSVRELVAQGRFPYQTLLRQWSADDAAAVDAAMNAADVARFADRRVSDLSGGQRQRCWIAMVLAQDTPVLLLDEPTTFLDLKVQVDLMQLLQDTARAEHRTIVIVLHDLNVAAAFADRLVMMKDGRVVADGAVAEVFVAARLADVFGLEARVISDPESGRPVCIPVARS